MQEWWQSWGSLVEPAMQDWWQFWGLVVSTLGALWFAGYDVWERRRKASGKTKIDGWLRTLEGYRRGDEGLSAGISNPRNPEVLQKAAEFDEAMQKIIEANIAIEKYALEALERFVSLIYPISIFIMAVGFILQGIGQAIGLGLLTP